MAILKCKMCGGDLNITADEKIVECEFCGTIQTIPTSKDENLQGLFNRANILRMKSEFDKAEQLYEKIIEKDDTQAEAYWGLILCKYGIEYVEDPKTFKRIPTCHRTSFDSIIADDDYKSALAHADSVQRGIYEAEAKEIDRIQKGILELSQKEEPYDVFICYKETDNDGKRTQDSVIANDIYYQLTQEGLKVFYAAITLENKLGSAYEPCIFAALNSAKVMLAIGTKSEYFNAVWVKNEWSRFLKIIQKDRSKLLIPCYRDMDAYELPEEFSHLQAQDMSKIGFINDIVRGIKKVVAPEVKEVPIQKTQVIENANGNITALLDRGFMALEDGEWQKADDFFEQVLNFDAKLAEAYLGKLMAELQVKTKEDLKNSKTPFDDNNQYKKVIRFGNENLKSELEGYIAYIKDRNEKQHKEKVYQNAMFAMNENTIKGCKNAIELFKSIQSYKDSATQISECEKNLIKLENQAEIERKDKIYQTGLAFMKTRTIPTYESAIKSFESISGWNDSNEKIKECKNVIQELKAEKLRAEQEYLEKEKQAEQERLEKEKQAEQERLEKEKQAEQERLRKAKFAEEERLRREKMAEQKRLEKARIAKRNKKIALITTLGVCVIVAFVILLNTVILPNIRYQEAMEALNQQQYLVAAEKFYQLGDFKDAKEQLKTLRVTNQEIFAGHIVAGSACTIGVKSDGSVIAVGDNDYGQCDVKDWEDIIEFANGFRHTVGLKSDGTVIAIGRNAYGQCDVSDWKDIVAIAAGDEHTVGLKADGTVVAVGYKDDTVSFGRCDVSDWKDIVGISAGIDHTVGLKADGTVEAVGLKNYGQCDVFGWTDIVGIVAGGGHTVGLRADGTVVAVGMNYYGQCDVQDWTDIVAISAGSEHTVGLKSDGTVVAVGNNYYGLCDVQDWEDIVAISAGDTHTVGLKADGTVVAIGHNQYGRCDVQDWDLF